MTLTFLKLYADMEPLFEPFADEEKGRLFSALMAYVFRGEDTDFEGNERFLWPVLRRHADACAENSRKMAENGAHGGKVKAGKANGSKKKQTEANDSQKEKEKEKEKEEEQEKEEEEEKEKEPASGETEPAASSPARDSDSHSGKNGEPVETLTREYGLSTDRITQEALREDLAQYGEDRLRAALREACLSNTRERVSVRFWRAILSGPREKKPAAFDYLTRPEAHRDDPDYWRALEVNLDEDAP